MKILNLFARTETNIYNKFYVTNDQTNLNAIRGVTKSTDLVLRTKKLINKSRETVPLCIMCCMPHVKFLRTNIWGLL